MFNEKIKNNALNAIEETISNKKKMRGYDLLSEMNVKPFFIDEQVINSTPSLSELSCKDLYQLYSKDYNNLVRVAIKNGEIGLSKLEKLNREMRLKHAKTIFVALDEFTNYYKQNEEFYKELLIRLTSNRSVFFHVNYEDTVLLLSSMNEFILVAAKSDTTSVSLKKVAAHLRASQSKHIK